MITALCRGKLTRELEGMEDLLTSAVFGRLKYLEPDRGLVPFLSYAKYRNGEAALPPASEITRAEYKFWPWWQYADCRGAEPDVVLELETVTGGRYTVLIEAKYRSGKSSEAELDTTVPSDQLGREWDNLAHACADSGSSPVMIYLTADFASPLNDLLASEAEYQTKRSTARLPFRCAWLSWRHLGPALQGCSSPVADDLRALLERLDMSFFHGIRALCCSPHQWRYRQLATPFVFDIPKLEKWTWTFRR